MVCVSCVPPGPVVEVTEPFSTSLFVRGGVLALPPGPSLGPSLGSHLSGLARVHAGKLPQ